MSYRIDADIYFPYFDMKFVYDQLHKGKEAIDDIIRKKTGIAVGFCIYWSCTNSSKNVILLWVLLLYPLHFSRLLLIKKICSSVIFYSLSSMHSYPIVLLVLGIDVDNCAGVCCLRQNVATNAIIAFRKKVKCHYRSFS